MLKNYINVSIITYLHNYVIIMYVLYAFVVIGWGGWWSGGHEVPPAAFDPTARFLEVRCGDPGRLVLKAEAVRGGSEDEVGFAQKVGRVRRQQDADVLLGSGLDVNLCVIS